jgi:hypothetical protein
MLCLACSPMLPCSCTCPLSGADALLASACIRRCAAASHSRTFTNASGRHMASMGQLRPSCVHGVCCRTTGGRLDAWWNSGHGCVTKFSSSSGTARRRERKGIASRRASSNLAIAWDSGQEEGRREKGERKNGESAVPRKDEVAVRAGTGPMGGGAGSSPADGVGGRVAPEARSRVGRGAFASVSTASLPPP